eukprot:TRINITY_DN9193_c0_g1_i3.p1 TRINITY_DN9193_c0_g1~~TRINITY_DN9193_c0_g1_i3.p1  ORF type:complete len:208 (+),score=32.68 TRINITY_DN9193_c0_g1_i3:355-978(+)
MQLRGNEHVLQPRRVVKLQGNLTAVVFDWIDNTMPWHSLLDYDIETRICVWIKLCEVLQELARHNLVDGDFRPQNVLLKRDLSISRIDMETLTNPCSSFVVQTAFSAPSLALQGFRHVGTDIYSIGCMILYTLSPAICRLMELSQHSMCLCDEYGQEIGLDMNKIIANAESDVQKSPVFTLAVQMVDERSGLQAKECLNQLRELQRP